MPGEDLDGRQQPDRGPWSPATAQELSCPCLREESTCSRHLDQGAQLSATSHRVQDCKGNPHMTRLMAAVPEIILKSFGHARGIELFTKVI